MKLWLGIVSILWFLCNFWIILREPEDNIKKKDVVFIVVAQILCIYVAFWSFL